MTDSQHNPSRRNVIASLIAAPVVASIPATAQTIDRTAWNRAFRHYQQERAIYLRHEREHILPAEAAYRAALPIGDDGRVESWKDPRRVLHDELWKRHVSSRTIDGVPIDEWSDMLVECECEAKWALYALPAPDQEALLWKLEMLWGDDPTASWRADIVEQVMADARRLLSTGMA